MGSIEKGSVLWPPRGWKQLACIKQSAGQALAKDIRTAKIFGLSFRIESEPLYQLEAHFFRHKIFIDGWQYSILNESSEYPVLSLTLTDRHDIRLPRESFVSDIRIMAKPLSVRPVVVQRVMMAAQLLIKQIQVGQVPDHERILSIYHLHPKRRDGYSAMGFNGPAAAPRRASEDEEGDRSRAGSSAPQQ